MTGYEKAYTEVIPEFRRLAARLMVKDGMTQQEVAAKLAITQAAVSKHIHSKGHSSVRLSTRAVSEYASAIKSGRREEARKIMCGVCLENTKFDCAFTPRA